MQRYCYGVSRISSCSIGLAYQGLKLTIRQLTGDEVAGPILACEVLRTNPYQLCIAIACASWIFESHVLV